MGVGRRAAGGSRRALRLTLAWHSWERGHPACIERGGRASAMQAGCLRSQELSPRAARSSPRWPLPLPSLAIVSLLVACVAGCKPAGGNGGQVGSSAGGAVLFADV